MINQEKGYQADELLLISDIDSNIAPWHTKNILINDLEREIMSIVNQNE